MAFGLSLEEDRAGASFRELVNREVAPRADRFDAEGSIPCEVFEVLARNGYFGAGIPAEYGGTPMTAVTFGLLCHELGRTSASLLSVFTVHTIVSHTLLRWGTRDQRAKYLPPLAAGRMKAAFALSEPEAGSDAAGVKTSAVLDAGHYVVNGKKKWTSAGAIADLFLVFATTDGGPTAFLVDRELGGISTLPIRDAFAFRSAFTANVSLEACRVPASNIVGRVGFGFSHVTSTALDHGRYCIAWGAAGLTRACLDASTRYATERRQFGVPLGEHQLIRKQLADMYTDASAAWMLCLRAGRLREQGASESIIDASTAKYFASRAAVRAALNAVQIHGANGLSSAYPAARYLRDAKVFEIIEGSNEIQQIVIGEHAQRSIGPNPTLEVTG